MKQEIAKRTGEIASVVVGSLLYAVAVVFLLEPTGIITGGATGIALFLNHEYHLSVSGMLFLLNAVMFILGWIFLGRKFALGSAVSSALIPIAMALLERIGGGYVLTEDVLLCALFGGLLIGVGLGLVMRVGFSTGGMDIPSLIMHRYWKIPVAWAMWSVDIVILLLQAVTATPDGIMYGILMVAVYSFVIDRFMLIGSGQMQVQMISRSAGKIREAILNTVDRGVTVLQGRTGFLREDTDVLVTVVSKRELRAVEKLVLGIDPCAFLVVTRVSAVSGRGFSMAKDALCDSVGEKEERRSQP